MRRLIMVLALALVLAGCWQFIPRPWANGYDVPWYARPFLYCFISASAF